jgi:hypothetical protein
MPTDFITLVRVFLDLIRITIPVLAGLALFVFFWGLAKFILRIGGDEKAIGEGKNLMKWGLIALFVMVSVWGILRFVYTDLGFSPSFGLPLLPE